LGWGKKFTTPARIAIEENNDATLKELTELLESKTGIKVSISID
jgi:transposase